MARRRSALHQIKRLELNNDVEVNQVVVACVYIASTCNAAVKYLFTSGVRSLYAT